MRAIPLVCLAAATMGCAEISLTTVDSQTEVLSRRQQVVAGGSVRVRSRIDGTTLYLQTNQGCDLVEMEEVRITEVKEADEDLTEEFVVLGLATLPLTTGIVMLVDAPNVYDNDRNGPQYNPVGKEGAYAGGTVLTAVGGIMALVPIIELFRVAAAGEETETETTRQGAVISSDVACDVESRPIRTSVTLRVGAHNLATSGTDDNGHLELDLAKAIPHEIAKSAVTVQVIVAGKVVGELDIEPILDAQTEMMRGEEAQSWQQVDRQRCYAGAETDTEACASVQAFLNRFPDGLHAEEARQLLKARALKTDKIIATDPGDTTTTAEPESDFGDTKAEAEKAQLQACRGACLKTCTKNKGKHATAAACVESCVEEVCQ